MVETKGIFVEGVPLEEHLIDKEKKKLYDDTQAEIAGQKKLTYHNSGVTMTVKHDTRPSRVRHLTAAEYYMKDNIKNCKVGAEYVLTMMQDGLPQTMNTLTERFKYWEIKVGGRGVRQAFTNVLKRYPDLFTKKRGDGRMVIYTMIPAACQITHQDLIMLWRKKISWDQMVEINQPLKRVLTSKILESKEVATVSFNELLQKMLELHGRVVGMDTNITDLNNSFEKLEEVLRGMGKEADHLIKCNNGLADRVHTIEERLGHYLEDDTGSRHVLDINVNFNFGKKEE